MPVPSITCRIDWANKGTFTGAYDAVSPLHPPDGRGIALSRGASADFASDVSGELSFDLDNAAHRYTADRNWLDNPSFELGTTGWSVAAIASLVAAATSISQVTDNATGGGTKAGEAVLTATLNSGVTFAIPYRFLSGVTYAVSIWLKSASGNLNVRAGLASAGTPSDIASSGANITASWAQYTFTWTPSADRSDVVLFVRTTTASAATVRIDAVQVNPGAAANAYVEGPTKGELTPGRPVHLYATLSGADTAKFYGYVHRITPNPVDETVTFVCRDVLQRLAETDVVVPANGFIQRSAREFRTAILEDFERGARNLLPNPSFETNTAGWSASNFTRITTDAAPNAGSACAEWAPAGAGSVLAPAYLAPVVFDGQVYRASVWLKSVSGATSVKIDLYANGSVASLIATRTVTITTAWQRFTIAGEVATTTPGNNTALGLQLSVTSGATLRVDGAAITRGQALYPYAESTTGRWANFVGNGTFDGGALSGWYDGWTNMVGNGSFETDTSGWSVAADSFHANAGTSITRTAGGVFGSWYGRVLVPAVTNTGAHYAITGTFKSGVTYAWSMWVDTGGTTPMKMGIGSNGTPTDKNEINPTPVGAGYHLYSGTWTPSADRTDAHIYCQGPGINFSIDGVQVIRRDTAAVSDPAYSDTGPGGGGSFVTTRAISTTVARWGTNSQEIATPATAGAGRVYDFNHFGPFFASGVQYSISVWLRATSSCPYKVGIGANKGDGTWDEASTTGTLTANTWTQVTLTWTPSADRTTTAAFGVVLFAYQTDATARTIYIDGVRVIPGATADDFEMSQWSLANETDQYLTAASLSGDALSALEALNALTLTRHWIRPTMTAPWYQYVTEGRDTFAAKASSASLVEDVQGWSSLDLDREAIVNIVPIAFAGAVEYYSDEASVRAFGPRPANAIGGAGFFATRAIPDIIGPIVLARYALPRIRPTLRVDDQYAFQLARDLNDVISVTLEKFLVRGAPFVILREDLVITQGGRSWVTTYKLEDFPY